MALILDDDERELVLSSLQREHAPAEAVRIVEAGELAQIVASLRRVLDNAEHALTEMHPNHPRRAAVALDRRRLIDLLQRLDAPG